MNHKKQHWIPKAYLKAWCDPKTPEAQEPYVWCFSKDGGDVKKKAPKNIFFERELYTVRLPDGVRDLTLEHGLAGLEDAFVTLRDQQLTQRATLAQDEKLLLCTFMGAMHSRTRSQLRHMQCQWKSALDMAESVRKQIRYQNAEGGAGCVPLPSLGPVDKNRSFSIEEIRRLAEGPVAPQVVAGIQVQLPCLTRMHLAVLCTEDPLGFITSDMPCVWLDPEAYKRPFPLNATGLGWPSIEITMPLSPSQSLLLSWRSSLDGYRDISPEGLDDLNRKTRFKCDEYFVVRSDEKREIWFAPGIPQRVPHP